MKKRTILNVCKVVVMLVSIGLSVCSIHKTIHDIEEIQETYNPKHSK